MKTLGIDIGSSSVKVAVLDANSGRCIASAQMPTEELPIMAPKKGWAEQPPLMWWNCVVDAAKELSKTVNLNEIEAVGITYQMHGLVAIDSKGNVVRPSIIWCDSRAVEVGSRAFEAIGQEKCLAHHLNTPGNFTASKLAWIKENEPEAYSQIDKIMLPGDYIAFKLSGEATTTAQGLSEGILWDFKANDVSDIILQQLGIDRALLSNVTPCFGYQCEVNTEGAALLGLKEGTPITYRSGDQPNNAFSLNVVNPGEIAATAGTSGVVYGVSSDIAYDPLSRVNTFMHVNHTEQSSRLGVLLCINGTGILNSWMRKNVAKTLSYQDMNRLAASVAPGADGLTILPFGNGAERVLENKEIGAHVLNIDFNHHTTAHVIRAAQEGIAFALKYGVEIMEGVGVKSNIIRAGIANIFQSEVFAQTIADITNARIELYDTNGALGAARGAAVGVRFYSNLQDAFTTLKVERTIEPQKNAALEEAYLRWKQCLTQLIKQ